MYLIRIYLVFNVKYIFFAISFDIVENNEKILKSHLTYYQNDYIIDSATRYYQNSNNIFFKDAAS